MNIYQRIADAALQLLPSKPTKLVVYCEAVAGGISADLFYHLPNDRVARVRKGTPAFCGLLGEFWRDGDGEKVAPRSWGAMHFLVENDNFDASLVYPDEFMPGQDLADRRSVVVKEHFPGLDVL